MSEQMRRALERIVAVEPFSGTPRLDVSDWADALDRAQRIAQDALDETGVAGETGGEPTGEDKP